MFGSVIISNSNLLETELIHFSSFKMTFTLELILLFVLQHRCKAMGKVSFFDIILVAVHLLHFERAMHCSVPLVVPSQQFVTLLNIFAALVEQAERLLEAWICINQFWLS